jgi:hypothetical protein
MYGPLIIFVVLMIAVVRFAQWGAHTYGALFVVLLTAVVLFVYRAIDRASETEDKE